MKGLLAAILGSAAIAAFCTLGDYLWAAHPPAQKTAAGLVHGALLFLAVGACLGAQRGRAPKGALGGLVIGLLAAASFYAMAPLLGYSAMFVSWAALWVGLGLLYGRWLHGGLPLRDSILRGLLAAVGSGLAFYAVSGIWMPFDPARRGYATHFACWSIAFLPGFLALLAGRAAKTSAPRST